MAVAQCLIKNKDKQGFQHIWRQLWPQLLLGVLCSETLLSQYNTKNAEPVASCLGVTLEGGAKPFISSPGIKSWSQKGKFKWLFLFSGPKHLLSSLNLAQRTGTTPRALFHLAHQCIPFRWTEFGIYEKHQKSKLNCEDKTVVNRCTARLTSYLNYYHCIHLLCILPMQSKNIYIYICRPFILFTVFSFILSHIF